MPKRLTTGSLWLIFAVALVVIVMIVFFMVVSGFTPGDVFDLFAAFMSVVAAFILSQLHAILR